MTTPRHELPSRSRSASRSAGPTRSTSWSGRSRSTTPSSTARWARRAA